MTSGSRLDEIQSKECRELLEKVFSDQPIETVRTIGDSSLICSNTQAFCLISAESGTVHHKFIRYADLMTVVKDAEEKWTLTYRDGQYGHTLNLAAQGSEYSTPLELALQEVCEAKIRFEESLATASIQKKTGAEVLLSSLGLLVALLMVPFGFIGINYLGLEGLGIISVLFLAVIALLVGVASIASSRSSGKLSGCLMMFLGITFLTFSAAVPWWLPVFVFIIALSAKRK